MGFIKFKDCKSVEEYLARARNGEGIYPIGYDTYEPRLKTIICKSNKTFGAINTVEFYNEERRTLSSILSAAYNTPEKVKKLFSLGDLYFLGTTIPDEQYIRGIERTLKDEYLIIEDCRLISHLEKIPRVSYRRTPPQMLHGVDECDYIISKITAIREKFFADGMTLSKATLNRLLGKAVKPKVHTSHNLKELYKGKVYLFDSKSGCWYAEQEGRQLFDQSGNLIPQSLRRVEKGAHSLNELIDSQSEYTIENLLNYSNSKSWVTVPEDKDALDDAMDYYKNRPKQQKEIADAYTYYHKQVERRCIPNTPSMNTSNTKKEQPQNITPRMVVMQLNKEFAQANSVYRVGYSEEHCGNKTRIVFKVWDNIERRGKPGMVCLDPLDIISRIYIGEKTRAVELVCAYHNQYSH